MYCRNCGEKVAEQAIVCPNCGVRPANGNNFCQNCGEGTDSEAQTCVKCGYSLNSAPQLPPAGMKDSQINDFLAFRRMITPPLIQIIFWIGAIGSFIGGIILIANAHSTGYYGMSNWSGGQILIGIIWMILGPLAVRVWCELIILFFRMYETLNEINNNTKNRYVTHK